MGKISSFITGASIGVAAALLLAPKTGEQTRAFVAEKANAVVGEAKDFGAGFPGAAQELIQNAQEKGAELVKTATGKGQEIASQVTGTAPSQPDDELRQKIEAARQRIAAQVAENAEATAAVEVPAE